MPSQTGNLWKILMAILAVGCNRPAHQLPHPQQHEPALATRAASWRQGSPQQYLAAVFARYRSAASYQDRGVVQLRYQLDGKTHTRTAPLQVWLEHNRLYVAAYDLRLWSEPDAVTAWIVEPASDNLDSQVLRLPGSGPRPRLESLFADPLLTERVSAGLAGPPPQLDWLLARQPMQQLFRQEHRFEFGPSEVLDDRPCQSVGVQAGPEHYRFWIDESAGVIRRVELPTPAIAQAAGSAQVTSLSLELVGASFDVPRGDPDLSSLPERPKYVHRFVPLPPPEPPALLGSQPASFELTDREQRFTLSTGSPDRELAILVRYSGDSASLAALAWLDRWQRQMPDTVRSRLRVGVLADEGQDRLVSGQLGLPVFVDRGLATAGALGLAPGALAILDRHGRLAWTQPALTTVEESAGTAILGAVIGDLLAGVDVPQRLRAQWREQLDAYHQALRQYAVTMK